MSQTTFCYVTIKIIYDITKTTFITSQDSDKLTEEEMMKLIWEMKKNGSTSKKLKELKIKMTMDIQLCEKLPPYTVTSDLLKVYYYYFYIY